MRTYIASKQVHSVLGKVLKPWFTEHGWKKRKGSTCAFLRAKPGNGGFWCFWVQCSQWGGSDFGNSFTVNVVPQDSMDQPLCGGPDARVLATLSSSDMEEGLSLEARIVARIPKPSPESRIYEWMQLPGKEGEIFRESWARAFVPHPEIWSPNHDVWLRYFAADDIEEWGAFIAARLSHLTAQCEANAA